MRSRVSGMKDSPVSNALEKMLVAAIVNTKRRKSFKVKKSSFNNLMLQFPKLRQGFKKVRDSFKTLTVAADAPLGAATRVPWAVFKEKCSTIGIDSGSASTRELLAIAEVTDDMLMSSTDLTLIYTVVYLLDANKKATIQYPEVKSALEIMEKAFCFFDSSSDGCIERKEMALAMKSGTRVFGKKASKGLADRLFDQLDWDGSGRITFKEVRGQRSAVCGAPHDARACMLGARMHARMQPAAAAHA